jgi:hypothetical protein
MSVSLTLDGMDRWMTLVDPDRFRSEIDRGMQKASQALRDETKKMPPVSAKRTGYAALGIPVDTGLTRQRIVSRKNGPLDYSDVAETDYSGAVHDGTANMPARPFFQWLLTDFGGFEKVEDVVFQALQRVASPN